MNSNKNPSSPQRAPTVSDELLRLARSEGILRPRDLRERGIPREYLVRLTKSGELVRVARGLYVLADADISEHHTLVQVAKRIPSAVVCLLTALRFHGLTTQLPFQVWVAIHPKAWRPIVRDLPVRLVYLSGPALNEGNEAHTIEGVQVRITTPAKTVADCFKFRNKIGLDVAMEALRDGWRHRRFTMDELWTYAKVDRVSNVIRPYLEALE